MCNRILERSGWRAPESRSGATAVRRVSSRYKSPFTFTGGTIAQVTVDLSGRPYEDLEKELALAFSRD